MKRRLPALSCGQLQKTEAPDRLTGIACLIEDQSDASTWRLSGNYSQGLCLHIPDCRRSLDGRRRRQWRRLWISTMASSTTSTTTTQTGEGFPPGHNGEGRCICRTSQPVLGIDWIHVVENMFSVVWEPGQYTTLAPWYPLDGRLGLTRPNQSASHMSKKTELWLPFLPWLMS